MLPKEVIELIKGYFDSELPDSELIEYNTNAPFWKIIYSYKNVRIEIEGDIGFNVTFILEGVTYPIWQLDRSTIGNQKTNSENLKKSLGIINTFLKDL